jgi:hypothetical protein
VQVFPWVFCRDMTENDQPIWPHTALQKTAHSPVHFGTQMLYTCHREWPPCSKSIMSFLKHI